MFRALFKLVILLIVLVAVGGFFLGWWGAGVALPERGAVATAGQTGAERAKRAGQDIANKAAEAGSEAKDALEDGALTAKIKAKMTLDDSIKARDLNVDTTRGVVTVTGTVHSGAERDRALALARETAGVRQVVDHVTVGR